MTRKSRNEVSLRNLIRNEVKQYIKEEDGTPQPEDKDVEAAFNKLSSDFSSIGNEVQTKLKDDAAVEDAMKKQPEIAKVATEGVKRKTKALAEGNVPAQLNEEITILFLASLALALPKIVELIGKGVKYVTIALGGKGKVGNWLEHAGHKMHETVLKLIMKMLTVVPGFKQLPPDKQEKVANIIHTCIIAGLAIASGVGAIKALQHGSHTFATLEGALAAIKGGEVATSKFVAQAISKVFG